MTARADIIALLSSYGHAETTHSLAEVAVLLGAADRPALSIERYHRHLKNLSEKVGDFARAGEGIVPVAVMAEALRQVLIRHYGYGGGESNGSDENCYDMTRVIDSRTGSSEALSILYAEAANKLGWAVEILHVAKRMLIRLESDGERLIVDPLGDGRTLEVADIRAIIKAYEGNEAELEPDGLRPLRDKGALLRLVAGKKSMLLRAKRLEEAAELIDIALLIAPEEPTLWRECGLLNARLDRIQAAVDALEEYLRLDADDNGRFNTTILLQELRGRLT